MAPESTQMVGTVTRQLVGADGKPKRQFRENKFWQMLHSAFGVDLRIPRITGVWTLDAVKLNTITTKGKEIAAKQLGGTTTVPVTAIALGTSTGGTTALATEIPNNTNGGGRSAATVTNVTTTTTGDTEQWVRVFTFTGSYAITEEGLFDSNTISAGNMLAYQSFAAVNVASGDSLTITHQVKFA